MNAVEISGRGYKHQAIVGSGLLDRVGTLIQEQTGLVRLDRLKQSSLTSASRTKNVANCAVITDTGVAKLFGDRVVRSLTETGLRPALVTIPPGEESKTFQQVGAICEQMLAARLDRQSFVIGLGGGVIGDISGFVSAIFQRGVPHVQLPTTLLAMVDSSIGGKTGVNTPTGKNLIGAVHQPTLVIDDIDVLGELPAREMRSGFAEIIKHAVIADPEMFGMLGAYAASQPVPLAELIERNVRIKAAIVAQDECDRTGERALLNFGHTVGHGIERAGDYRTFTHGEAISLGMVAAANISLKRAQLPARDRDAIVDLLKSFALPTTLSADFPRDRIIDALQFDKKFEHGQVRFVVTSKIGSARLTNEVTLTDICEAVEEL